MRPSFSIIIPAFNALAKLEDTVASVTRQAPGLFECLVIDGASTDGTRAWLEQRRLADIRWLSEPDAGVYDAMNKGINMAQGRFLCFLGAGDRLLPGILERAARFIAGLPEGAPRMVCGDVRLLARGGAVLGGPYSRRTLCTRNISHQAIFYERSIFELRGGYSLKYPVYADWAFNLGCFGDDRIVKCYWQEIVTDFDGGGISDRVQDFPFAHDRLALIREHFGSMLATETWLRDRLRCRWEKVRCRWQGRCLPPD